jgi:hypothetical protein
VNLATYLLLDAFKGGVDIALLVSNDAGLAEPVKITRAKFGLRIWLPLPCRSQPSTVLRAHADAVRPIRKGALAASQFPVTLTDATGTFSKPPHGSRNPGPANGSRELEARPNRGDGGAGLINEQELQSRLRTSS